MKRTIVDPRKDAKGSYQTPEVSPPPPEDPPSSDISLDDLLQKSLLLLYRDTRALLVESAHGDRLSKDAAHSMRENAKLIMELKKREKELLDDLTPEELEELARAHV